MSEDLQGLVFDIRRFSVEDGPGIRTTVFFKGCPLSCWWCHNPESQNTVPEVIYRKNRCIHCGACIEICAENALSENDQGDIQVALERCARCGACVEVCPADARELAGRWMTPQQVFAEIERDLPFYDESGGGVTFSGGEPLSQPRFLSALLQICKENEIHTALDTCGYATWETLTGLRDGVDLFLYDLKLVDDRAHRRFTGVSNQLILHNLAQLVQTGANLIVRLPVIPGITDTAEALRQFGDFLQSISYKGQVDLLPYHHSAMAKYDRMALPYLLEKITPPSDEHLDEIAGVLRMYGFQVQIGG